MCEAVLFQPQQRQLWPRHWGGWVADATVLLPMDAVLNGSLDVLAALSAIPKRRVARMQQVLRRNAHRLHYALVGSPDAAGDALEISLAHLGTSVQGELGRAHAEPAFHPPPIARCRRRGRHRLAPTSS